MTTDAQPPSEFAAAQGSASSKLEPAVESGTRRGLVGVGGLLDTVQLGDNVEVLSTLPDECIDLVVTSPPYDTLRVYGGFKLNFQNIASELIRVVKPGGVIVWVVADETINGGETGSSFRQALWFMDNGMKLSDTMTYGKNASSPNVNQPRYMQSSEYMFVLVKGDRVKTFNPLMAKNTTAGKAKTPYRKMQRNGEAKTYGANAAKERAEEGILSNIWIYNTGAAGGEDAIAFDHPAPFPLKLAKDHIESWSNPGDLVLDPFAGSGTTLKAAKELNRHWLGIEINPAYVQICKARLSQDVLALFSGGGGAEHGETARERHEGETQNGEHSNTPTQNT